jgi:hypothetical protein
MAPYLLGVVHIDVLHEREPEEGHRLWRYEGDGAAPLLLEARDQTQLASRALLDDRLESRDDEDRKNSLRPLMYAPGFLDRCGS